MRLRNTGEGGGEGGRDLGGDLGGDGGRGNRLTFGL